MKHKKKLKSQLTKKIFRKELRTLLDVFWLAGCVHWVADLKACEVLFSELIDWKYDVSRELETNDEFK